MPLTPITSNGETMIRRKFIQTSGLLSLVPWVPRFVHQLSQTTRPKSDENILVVVEMNGGNDGINTLVPFRDDVYPRCRPTLKVQQDRLLGLSDEMGFHPAMRASKELFDDGELCVINGVGYPNPTRSHFESLEIWHRGIRKKGRESGAGWLGNALDISRSKDRVQMDGYFIGDQAVSQALVSRRAQIAALARFSDLKLNENIRLNEQQKTDVGDISSFVQRQLTNAYATSSQLTDVPDTSTGGFPSSQLGQQMRLISQLIKGGSGARVYYTVQRGYDTHSIQANRHSELLSELSNATQSLVNELKKSELAERVIVLAFSEFGRRVNENASFGTDHGTAGPVFLAGSRINAGLIGKTTSLSDLVDGDLRTQFDFRQIYATLLDRWLKIDSEKVLDEKFEHLDLIQS